MKLTRLIPLGLLVVAVTAAAQTRPPVYKTKTPPPARATAPATPTPTPAPGKKLEYVNGIADTGQFLPDTAVLATIGPRTVTVRSYVNAYFAQYPEYRPRPDSLGRIDFLNSMIQKDVLGMTALSIPREFGFEDRLAMRMHTQRTLSNAVYQHYVLDSVKVTDDEVRAFYETQKYDQHFRHILFADRATAQRVRDEIASGKLKWDVAFGRYHKGAGKSDLGWVEQTSMPPEVAVRVYPLQPGQISQPVADRSWWHVFQSVEHRPRTNVPPIESMRTLIRMTIGGLRTSERAEAIQVVLRARIGMRYDTTAVQWVSTRFGGSNMGMETGPGGSPSLSIADTVPVFAPEDTSRTLAVWNNGGRLSLAGLLKAYTDLSPVSRPLMNTPEAVQGQIDAIVLEPYMAEYGLELGIDKDPEVVAQIERKREELLVKHMFSDSVESKVWISKADRQKYYKEHPSDFTTYANVRFAVFAENSREAADALAKRLRGGEKAEAILAADSIAGIQRGSIQVRLENEHGPYHKLLFEEMRPGQVTVEGPDREGHFAVMQSIAFDPGHLLPYEEVEGLIDESMQNVRGEQMLKAMLARFTARYPITARYELLQKVKLVDPTLDE